MKVSSRHLILNFSLFALFTSAAYVFYESLLREISPSLLLLNSFVWIFLFRVFFAEDAPRSPLRPIRVSVDSYQLAYALSLFGYWYLFWHGIALVPEGGEASKTAVAFLALNTVFAPIAGYIATPRHQRTARIWIILVIGCFLFLSIIIMEADATAVTVYEYLRGLEDAFKAFIGSIPIDRDIDVHEGNNRPLSGSYIGAASCFLSAIICEAVADYLNTRRQLVADTEYGGTLSEIQLTAARIEVFRASIGKVDSLLGWIRFAIEASESRLNLSYPARDKAKKSIDEIDQFAFADRSSGAHDVAEKSARTFAAICAKISELEKEQKLLRELESRTNANGAISIPRRDRIKLARIVKDRYWAEALSKASIDEPGNISFITKKYVQQSGDDLFATIGLALSIMTFLAFPYNTGLRPDWGVIGQAIGLLMVGALGSTARILFINPMIGRDKEVLELVPPIYAVRPIVLFALLYMAVRKFELVGWLSQFEAFSSIQTSIIDRNFGWVFGASLALLAAVASWVVVLSARRPK